MKRDLKKIVSQMTLEEKAGMCSGLVFCLLNLLGGLGSREVLSAAGPPGLRKQDDKGDHLGMNDSIKAVCFPPAGFFACLLLRPQLVVGIAIAIGAQAHAVDVATGPSPALHTYRSPLADVASYTVAPFLAVQVAAAPLF